MIFWSQSPWSKYGPLGAKGLSTKTCGSKVSGPQSSKSKDFLKNVPKLKENEFPFF